MTTLQVEGIKKIAKPSLMLKILLNYNRVLQQYVQQKLFCTVITKKIELPSLSLHDQEGSITMFKILLNVKFRSLKCNLFTAAFDHELENSSRSSIKLSKLS